MRKIVLVFVIILMVFPSFSVLGSAFHPFDAFSTIKRHPFIEIVSPNGGEQFVVGEVVPIEWKSKHVKKVDICVWMPSQDGVDGWPPGIYRVLAENFPAHKKYSWNITREDYDFFNGGPRQLCGPEKFNLKILIFDSRSSYHVYDGSDECFSLSRVILLSPNGGEQWLVGGTYNITWKGGSPDDEIQIGIRNALYDPNLAQGEYTIVFKMQNMGSYEWTVPQYDNYMSFTDGNVYKVVIYTWGSGLVGQSHNFSITLPVVQPKTIRLISPNGGEVWRVRHSYLIEWNTTGFGPEINISICLMDLKKGSNALIVKTKNTGVYKWKIPFRLQSSPISFMELGWSEEAIYKIHIVVGPENPMTRGGGPADRSDGNFSILLRPHQRSHFEWRNGFLGLPEIIAKDIE